VAVETLFGRDERFLITEAIDRIPREARPLRHILADRAGAKARLRRLVGDSRRDRRRPRTRRSLRPWLLTRPIAANWFSLGGDAPIRAAPASPMCWPASIRDRPDVRGDLLDAFVTKEGEARKSADEEGRAAPPPGVAARLELERCGVELALSPSWRAELVIAQRSPARYPRCHHRAL
jgi:hypothetical protein